MVKKVLATFLLFSSFSFSSVCDVDITDHLPKMPPSVKIVSKKEKYGLCEIVIDDRGQFVIVYATKDFALFGDLIRHGKSETQELYAELRKKLFLKARKELDKLTAVVYKPPGKPKDVVYFISDPDCPYCNAVKKKVKELADKYRVEIRLVWFPLPMHQEADEKAAAFICEKKSYEDYLKGNYGSKECKEGKDIVEQSIRIVQDLGVNGTPTFFFRDGTIVVGANMKALESQIERRLAER